MSVLGEIARRGRRVVREWTLPARTLVFLHIPKTGGMSLREILLREARGRPTFWIVDPVKDLEWMKSIPVEKREQWVLVEGHMYYGLHEWLPRPCEYMTMLRDPVERVLSYWSHVQEREDHHLHVAARGLPVGEGIRRGLTVELDNFMVRALTGVEKASVPFGGVTRGMLEEAKENLARIRFVGFTEKFEESVRRFGRELGWQVGAMPRVNVSGKRVSREEVDVGEVERVNSLDRELYEFGVELSSRAMR